MKRLNSIWKSFFIVILAFSLTQCEKDDNNGNPSDHIDSKHNFGTLTDNSDGKTYKTIQIGDQVWMAENLAHVPDSGNYRAYDDDQTNVATYGYLYDWETAQLVAPDGWHLPSKEEFQQLEDYLAENGFSYTGELGSDAIAKALCASTNWNTDIYTDGAPSNNGYPEKINMTGFSALAAGLYHYSYSRMGTSGYWWSSTNLNDYVATTFHIRSDYTTTFLYSIEMDNYFSVRCIKD